MLTGTLITAAGVHAGRVSPSRAPANTPSPSSPVVTIALLVSWVVAVVFTPYLGYKLLDAKKLRKYGAGASAATSTTRLSTAASARWWSGACATAGW